MQSTTFPWTIWKQLGSRKLRKYPQKTFYSEDHGNLFGQCPDLKETNWGWRNHWRHLKTVLGKFLDSSPNPPLGMLPNFFNRFKEVQDFFFKIHRDKSWKGKGGLRQTLCACDNFRCFFSLKTPYITKRKCRVEICWGHFGRWSASRPCESRRNFRRMHLDRKSQFSTLARMVHAVHFDKRICMNPKTWGKGNKKNKDQEGSGEFLGVFVKLNRKKKSTPTLLCENSIPLHGSKIVPFWAETVWHNWGML